MIRFLLFRVLPRRLVPIITFVEIALFLWRWRANRAEAARFKAAVPVRSTPGAKVPVARSTLE